ncbi:MAG: AAA family ATPase, partial [Synergistaceae bacterium]|nr:AAA family ATPase [Synergistaceae bacterium]
MNGKITGALPKLPIGIQEFEKLRTERYLYVDKTKYLVDLIDNGAVYFLSRPRRFGKSLTVSTFDALFSGKRELFKGLYAEEFLDRPGFSPSPVLWLDMSKTTTDLGTEELRGSMLNILESEARRYDIALTRSLPDQALAELLETLGRRERVVVLVDEYDKPVIDSLDDPQKANAFRAVLRGFYTQIKAADRDTRFVFMTGITKFTKTGVFSAMNNLKDISMKDDYAAMLGYTEDELRRSFAPHIARMAGKFGLSEPELLARVKAHYDGFSFDGKTQLYNPF